jgi:hypothetical protein
MGLARQRALSQLLHLSQQRIYGNMYVWEWNGKKEEG